MTKPLEPPYHHFASAAAGWFELGNVAESKAELERIPEALQNHPDVLEVRWAIAARENNWAECLDLARLLTAVAPERSAGWLHQAYSLRRVPGGGLRQAWEALLPVADKFPTEPIIAYNLSCYACQLEDLKSARHWFRRAMHAGDGEALKRMALRDEDLKPLWPEIPFL